MGRFINLELIWSTYGLKGVASSLQLSFPLFYPIQLLGTLIVFISPIP